MAMEQQAQEQAQARKEPVREDRQNRPPEQERIQAAAETARAALAGVSLGELAPDRLMTLASWLGNSGMEALLNAQASQPELETFQMPADGLATAPFPAPEISPVLAAPQGLTAAESGGRAFDPAGLQV